MTSERRIKYEEMQNKLDVFEEIIEVLNNRVVDNGETVYTVPRDELENMDWSEQRQYIMRTSEGLVCSRQPYEDDVQEDWKVRQNKRYDMYVDAFKVCRTALEKWLDK